MTDKKPINEFMLFINDVRLIKDNKKPSTCFPNDKLLEIKKIIENNNYDAELLNFWKDINNKENNKYENIYKTELAKYKK